MVRLQAKSNKSLSSELAWQASSTCVDVEVRGQCTVELGRRAPRHRKSSVALQAGCICGSAKPLSNCRYGTMLGGAGPAAKRSLMPSMQLMPPASTCVQRCLTGDGCGLSVDGGAAGNQRGV
jgi:hypothetical protein